MRLDTPRCIALPLCRRRAAVSEAWIGDIRGNVARGACCIERKWIRSRHICDWCQHNCSAGTRPHSELTSATMLYTRVIAVCRIYSAGPVCCCCCPHQSVDWRQFLRHWRASIDSNTHHLALSANVNFSLPHHYTTTAAAAAAADDDDELKLAGTENSTTVACRRYAQEYNKTPATVGPSSLGVRTWGDSRFGDKFLDDHLGDTG